MDVGVIRYGEKEAEKQFVDSLKNTGFAVLKDHPISEVLMNNTYQVWKDFFRRSVEDKNQYLFDARETGAQTGYFPFKAENAKGYSIRDLKEFFHYAPHKKAPQEQAVVTEKYFQEVTKLAQELLNWTENGLPSSISEGLSMPLSQMAAQSQLTLLRVLHYPPLCGEEEEGAVRAAPHEDINLITLLPFATSPGLQIKDSQGNWHVVPGDPGMIVVNVGDMLAHATQNYYKSTTHRVINPESQKNEARYSLPLFFQPNNDVRLSSTHTAGSYFEERFREQGLVKDENVL